MKRVFSLILLCAVLLLNIISCGNETEILQTPDESDVVSEVTTIPIDANDRLAAVSSLPADLDFGGDVINVAYVDHYKYRTDIIGEQDGDTINEAIYQRNLIVEENLNITLNKIPLSDNTQTAANLYASTVLAGDDVFDIYTGHQAYTSKLLLEGYFANLADDPYIDYYSPWWSLDYMKELTVGNETIYFLFGDISLMMLKSMGCVYFNKQIFEDNFASPEDLYTTVLDGKWTLDLFGEYSKNVYNDINGNGKPDEGDIFGFTAITAKHVDHFQYNAGIRTSQRDLEGIPKLILNNERTVSFADKLYNLYYNNIGAKISTKDDIDGLFLTMFKSNETLFNPSWFYTAELLRDMETDFGVIPWPKLDENQEDYMTLVHDGSTLFCVPVTCQKTDMIGAVLEELAFNSYKLITPAYFEIALKEKYTRDNVSSQIIDMIYAGAYTDFAYVYYMLLNNIGVLRPLASGKTNDFASFYASREEAALIALDQIIDNYLEKHKT